VRRKGLFILAGGLALLFIGPFLIPVPPLNDTLTPSELADGDSLFVEVNDQTLHVKKIGTGEPVFLLLHGFASSLYSWRSVMQPLSELGTVIAYDRTGFGLSERPLTWDGQNPYSKETQVELAMGLLDHYGIKQAILVGNSAGGTLAMEIALEHPERVTGLILVDPAVYNSGAAPQWLRPLLALPQMRHLGPLISRQLLNRGSELIKLAWYNPSLLSQDALNEYQKPFQVENWDRALWEFTLASNPSNLSKSLNEITTPVMVITGEHDRIVPTSSSVRLAGELPNARLEIIPEAGHVPHEERPELFMDAVKKYISEFQP
jgi:pimeloyl-ACP methyl ester carboxylesterase